MAKTHYEECDICSVRALMEGWAWSAWPDYSCGLFGCVGEVGVTVSTMWNLPYIYCKRRIYPNSNPNPIPNPGTNTLN